MYVVTFTDGSTYTCYNYESDDGGLTFLNKAGNVQMYAPNHSVRYIKNTGSAGGDSGQTDSSAAGGTGANAGSDSNSNSNSERSSDSNSNSNSNSNSADSNSNSNSNSN